MPATLPGRAGLRSRRHRPAPDRSRRSPRALVLSLSAVVLSSTMAGCFSAPAQIISLEPNRGSTSVAADAPIRVTFDHAVQHESVARHFTVDRPISGCNLQAAFRADSHSSCYVQWLTDQPGFELRHPGAIFTPNQTYTFVLGAGVVDVNGTVNSLDHRWDITIAPAPAVVADEPSSGSSVSRDVPIAVTFSRPMLETTTSAAIALDPPVAGLRVVRNSRDHSRFEVLPGHLLAPNTAYVLRVTPVATDEHRQPLDRTYEIHFRTGVMSAGGHLLVVANRRGEGATTLYLSRLQAATPGEPVPSVILRQSPRCADVAGCGLVATGGPLVTYRDAGLAPGARWLAVVESDQTVASAPTRIRIVDLSTDRDEAMIPGASLPAWSPDGTTLAYAASDGSVGLYQPGADAFSRLPSGAPLVGTPAWTADGLTLALPVDGVTSVPAHVELAAPAVGARYTVPGLTGVSDGPVAAPEGSRLAVHVHSASGTAAAWFIDIAAGQKPRALAGDLTPIGFTDSGALIAIDHASPAGPALVRDSLDSGDISPLATAAGMPDLNTVTVSTSGRQVAYVAEDGQGIAQAVIANADGSGPVPLTQFDPTLSAISVRFGG